MIRRMVLAAAAAGVLVGTCGVAPGANAGGIPLPIDLNCLFAQWYFASVNLQYGGDTSCSREISHVAGQASLWLGDKDSGTAVLLDTAPYQSCSSCAGVTSSDTYPIGTGLYTIEYKTWLEKSKYTFGPSWPPDCRRYNNNYGLYCDFKWTIAIAAAVKTPVPISKTWAGSDPTD